MKININDEATLETVNTVEGKTAVDELLSTLEATKTLKPFTWSAALQAAGQDWVSAVVASTSISASVNGSNTATRAAKYGDLAAGGKDVYQAILSEYNFNGLNAVIQLLVDDGRKAQNRPNRAAILSEDFTQIAANYALSTALTDTTIYTANFADAKFTNKSGISCSNFGTSTTTTTVITGNKRA